MTKTSRSYPTDAFKRATSWRLSEKLLLLVDAGALMECIDSCFEHAQACAETCRCCESACNNLFFAVGVQTLPLKPSSG